ncbi:MAG TPA: hypothetical protein VGK78_06625 [Nocardioides sp.]|uniref:hypothetical protein n=1 Tax=Nocardioides sp. TaxID=35761 RepID=UPI002F3FAEF1
MSDVDAVTLKAVEDLAGGKIADSATAIERMTQLMRIAPPQVVLMSLTSHAASLLKMLAAREGRTVDEAAKRYRENDTLARFEVDLQEGDDDDR